MGIAERLRELGIELPQPAAPLAAYVGYVAHAGTVVISGQLPLRDGEPAFHGVLGESVTIDDGYQAARLCAINVLAQLRSAVDGDWSRVDRCIRLGGFVAAVPVFEAHPKVVNGASELIAEVLGERGAHARAAVGVASLPLGVPVEVEATFALR